MNIYDVHIKNGEIIDGTGAPKFKSDIVIDNGKIIGVFPAENGDVRDPSENHFLSNFEAKLTINAENKIVSPGFIVSDMTTNLPEKVKEQLTWRIPMARLGNGDDVSNCVAFLSSETTSYVTGETIHVNGGMYMAWQRKKIILLTNLY